MTGLPDPDSSKSNHLPWPAPRRSWPRKFGDAFSGIAGGVRGESSFLVHTVVSLAVVILAVALQVSWERWCLLLLCIATVIAAELFNSSLERLCRCITNQHNDDIAHALNIASGAVLVLSIFSAIIGSVIFASHLLGW